MITDEKYNVHLAKISNKQIMVEFAKEMYVDEKASEDKSTRDATVIKLLKSLAFMASGISTMFSPENLNDLCDRIKLLVQEKQSGNITHIIIEEIVAIADKLIQYNCISKKQQKLVLLKCLN